MKKIFVILISLCVVCGGFAGIYARSATATDTAQSTRVAKVEHLLLGDNFYYSIQVTLSDSLTNADEHIENAQNLPFMEYIYFNGKSLRDIADNSVDYYGYPVADAVVVFLFPDFYLGPSTTGKTIFHIKIFDEIDETCGGVRQDGNTLTVKKGLVTPSGKVVDRDYDFRYDGVWHEIIDTDGLQWGELNLLAISKPVYEDEENVSFTLRFDKPVAHKEMRHINADINWLNAVSAETLPPFYYSDAELQLLAAYGILPSIKTHILFNGESIGAMMAKDPNPARSMVSVMVHLGLNGVMNEMKVVFAGLSMDTEGNSIDGYNKITDLDQAFAFTLKKGFKTSTVNEIKKDVSFTYNAAVGVFIKQAMDATGNNVNISSVYYNGFEIIRGGTLRLKSVSDFDARLLSIALEDDNADYEIQGISQLQVGDNAVTVSVTAPDGTRGSFSFTLTVDGTGAEQESGCKSTVSGKAVWSLFLFAGLASMIYIRKRAGSSI